MITEVSRKAAWRCQFARRNSRVKPLPAVAFEQKIGFVRTPGSCAVLGYFAGARGAPNVENRIDKRPRGFDIVTAVEKRRITTQTIVDKRGVSGARNFPEAFLVAEIHGDVADAHFRAGTLCAEGNGDALFRLDVEDETVRLNIAITKDKVRGALELNHDLRAAFGETFSGAQIKRNAGPAPVVNV